MFTVLIDHFQTIYVLHKLAALFVVKEGNNAGLGLIVYGLWKTDYQTDGVNSLLTLK